MHVCIHTYIHTYLLYIYCIEFTVNIIIYKYIIYPEICLIYTIAWNKVNKKWYFCVCFLV